MKQLILTIDEKALSEVHSRVFETLRMLEVPSWVEVKDAENISEDMKEYFNNY